MSDADALQHWLCNKFGTFCVIMQMRRIVLFRKYNLVSSFQAFFLLSFLVKVKKNEESCSKAFLSFVLKCSGSLSRNKEMSFDSFHEMSF